MGGEKPGYVYSSRYSNPTTGAFETAVAMLEGTETAVAFASGMAAIHMGLLTAGVQPGTSVVAAADVYGATYTMLRSLFANMGAAIHFVNVLDIEHVRQTMREVRPAALLVETISNPLLKLANLPVLSEIAHETGALFLVDNTFCSPYLCNPVKYGADMVIHSGTKYLSGHGDVMIGVVALSHVLRERMTPLYKMLGSSPGPFEAWLAMRGLKTLGLRMRQQSQSALALAQWLEKHPKVARVIYPYLPDHPRHELAMQLTGGRGGGGVLSFELQDGSEEKVYRLMDSFDLIQSATTLGDIYTLVLYPVMASHRALTPAEREAVGIAEGLVRLSVGIEAIEDIQADLEAALGRI